MSFYNISELKTQQPAEGVELRIITGAKMSMAFFRLQPGAVIPEHTHPHEQMGTVLQGAMEVTIADEKQIVTEGAAYHIPSDQPHSGRCLDKPAQVLEVFSPPREDLIPE